MTRSTKCTTMTNITFLDLSLDYFRCTAVKKNNLILPYGYPYRNRLHISLRGLIIEHDSYITMHIVHISGTFSRLISSTTL